MYIDVDTHIDECEDTWAYMPEELRPTTVTFDPDQIPKWLVPSGSEPSAHTRFWFMDGQLHTRRIRSDDMTGTTEGTRELRDIPTRVKHMDELNIATQVIYPTVFNVQLTERPDFDLELCKSYNRWLADRCADSGGRIRWVAIPPYGTISEAVDELTFAKEHGAVGVLKKGSEWGVAVSDPYFFPVYAAAQDLELPICIHASQPWYAIDPRHARTRPSTTNNLNVLEAFLALATDKIPLRFPQLKFGFIEAGSSWLPYLFEMTRPRDLQMLDGFLKESRFFVTCEVKEDLAYLIGRVGDDNLMVGTDYTHGDRASVLNAHSSIAGRADLGETSRTKIVENNGAAFYGF